MKGQLEIQESSLYYTIYTRQNNEINYYNNVVMKLDGKTRAVLYHDNELMNRYSITISDIKSTIDDYEYRKYLAQQKIDSFEARKNAIANMMSSYADINKVKAYIDVAYKQEIGEFPKDLWFNSTDEQIIENIKIAIQMGGAL